MTRSADSATGEIVAAGRQQSLAGPPAGATAAHRMRLGEELPIFCEKCGYLLHGAVQIRCDRCEILHFRCPECGHTQAINTLRPAFQRILGRVRALALAFWVFFKINYFFWLLFAWGAMGFEWSYQYESHRSIAVSVVPPAAVAPAASTVAVRPPRTFSMPVWAPREFDWEAGVAYGLFAVPFAIVSRMLLLRWRRGALVGLSLSGLVILANVIGAFLRQADVSYWYGPNGRTYTAAPSPFTMDFAAVAVIAAGGIMLGALIAWPIWVLCTRLLLPQRTASALLDWQRAMSEKVSHLARE